MLRSIVFCSFFWFQISKDTELESARRHFETIDTFWGRPGIYQNKFPLKRSNSEIEMFNAFMWFGLVFKVMVHHVTSKQSSI